MKIYIIEASPTNIYEDLSWVVKAFSYLEEAEDYVKSMERVSNIDGSTTEYTISECELD